MKLKSECCEKYKKESSACKRCPLAKHFGKKRKKHKKKVEKKKRRTKVA